MELSVLVQPLDGRVFRASSGDPLPATADGPTRDEALDNLRGVLEAKAWAGAEVVRIRVGPQASPVWPDDSFTRDWLDGIAAARAKADARPDPWGTGTSATPSVLRPEHDMSATHEHNSLLAAIAANPDDDTPRLVFADWLEENGDAPRAAFISAQCRLAQMGPCDPERFALEADQEDLLEKHQKKWLKSLPKVGASVEFVRGFPHHFTLSIPKFLEHGEALLAAVPTLGDYHPLNYATGWEKFVNCPALGQLTGLRLNNFKISAGRAAALLASPQVANLRFLSIGGSNLGLGGGTALAASRCLINLRRLVLVDYYNGDRTIAALAASSHFPNLVSLDLRNNVLIGLPGVRALGRSMMAAQLEDLAFGTVWSGDEMARAFAEGNWRSLRKLSLKLGGLTSEGIEALAGCPSLTALRELELEWDHIGDLPSTASLFASPYLTQLERMSLPSAGAVDSFEALARSPMLSRLRGLVVNYGTEDAAGTSLGVVIDSPKAAGLVELEIHGSSDTIVADLVRRFTRANHLTNLRKLKFTNPPPNPSWVADFLASAQLAGVVDLDLGALDEAGLHALVASPHLSGLRRLRLWPWTVENVSPSTLARLEKRFPGVVKVM